MEIIRAWAMPSKNTFKIKPIREFIDKELEEFGKDAIILDAFANSSKLGTITNDLNPKFDTDYHLDALTFFKQFEDNSVDVVLYDPPYSVTQVKEVYDNIGEAITNECRGDYWRDVKNEIARVLKVGGKVLSFSWNSIGIGKTRGMEIEKILMVCHGGMHNDTICVADRKVQNCKPKGGK